MYRLLKWFQKQQQQLSEYLNIYKWVKSPTGEVRTTPAARAHLPHLCYAMMCCARTHNLMRRTGLDTLHLGYIKYIRVQNINTIYL